MHTFGNFTWTCPPPDWGGPVSQLVQLSALRGQARSHRGLAIDPISGVEQTSKTRVERLVSLAIPAHEVPPDESIHPGNPDDPGRKPGVRLQPQ